MGNQLAFIGQTCCTSTVGKTNEIIILGDDSQNKSRLTVLEAHYQREALHLQVANIHHTDARMTLKSEELTSSILLNDSQRIDKIRQVADTSPILNLYIVSSSTISKRIVVQIHPLGYEDGLRNSQDGVTYFGCKKRLGSGRDKGPIVNDFIIRLLDKNVADQHRGQHFMIFFEPESRMYMIKDLAVGLGTFYKMKAKQFLKDNMLINIGESYIVTRIDTEMKLRLEFFGKSCTGQVMEYDIPQIQPWFCQIGRSPKCDIQILDSLLSKFQTSIYYDQIDGWMIADGDANLNRPSTNGTWIYIGESMILEEGMMFKSNLTLFQVSYQNK